MLSAILNSKSGKIGIFSLLVLIAISLTVMFRNPSDFGNQIWNNPTYWADHPKLAAPSWTTLFDSSKIQHQVLVSSSPTEVITVENRKTLEYHFDVKLSSESDPTFLSFSVSQLKFHEVSPIITVFLEQGEQRLFVYRYVVPQKAADEPSPVIRYIDNPFRVQLTSDFKVEQDISEFFDSLRQLGEKEFKAIVRVNVTNPQDTVGEVRFIAGGEVFGWIGTDNVGRNLAEGILFGLPIALLIGAVVAVFATLIGAVVGAVSAYVGGKVDAMIQRFIDVIMSLPALVIIIYLVFIYGAKLSYIIIFIIFFSWPNLAIEIRPLIMQIKENGFIAHAHARGLSGSHIVFKELLPQTSPLLLANFILVFPKAILAEAALSFLGLSDPSIPTWGYMLQQGFQTGAIFLGHWWWVLAPGIAIVLTTLVFVLISNALEEYTEPRLQRLKGGAK